MFNEIGGHTIRDIHASPAAKAPRLKKNDAQVGLARGDQFEEGQDKPDIQNVCADLDAPRQALSETQHADARGSNSEQGQYQRDDQFPSALPDGAGGLGGRDVLRKTASRVSTPTIAQIRTLWRMRQYWHRAEKSLTLSAKALCRGLAHEGDKKEADKIYRAAFGKGEHPKAELAYMAIFPLTEQRDNLAKHRKTIEKRLTAIAHEIPASGFIHATKGAGMLGFAGIIGEAGDLSNYANPGKLWKRMGLAVMPDGRAQRRVSDAAGALAQGYNPARRSFVFTIGDSLIKAGGEMKALYDARKLHELTKTERPIIAHRRAQRYMEKRFLRELWRAWKRGQATQGETSFERMPGPVSSGGQASRCLTSNLGVPAPLP